MVYNVLLYSAMMDMGRAIILMITDKHMVLLLLLSCKSRAYLGVIGSG